MAGAGVRDLLVDGPWVHRDIAANGIRFHVALGVNAGPERPLVVFLHGFGEFWWAWRHQIPALDAAGYAVAALDLRGYGASDKTPRGYDPQTTGSDVAGVIRSLGHSEAIVVGHDWGGMAAWATSAYAPAQIRGLVNVSAPHPLAFPWRSDVRRWAFFQLPLVPERRIMAEDGAFVAELLRRGAAPGSAFPSPEEARRYSDALMVWPSPHCALEYPRMFVRDRLRPAGRAYRSVLRQPRDFALLSVHGQSDPVLGVEAMTAAHHWVHGSQELVDLPGAGHVPHEEDPGAFTAVLLDWLSRHAPTPR